MDEDEKLTSYIHDLFLDNEYMGWRKSLKKYEQGKWYSLIVKLDKSGAPVDRLKTFGKQAYSKLVFSCIKAPDYQESKMLMIQFTISGGIWHSVVWHDPEKN